MVVLHGLGDSAQGYRFLPAALAVPSLNYLLVNAPDEYYGGFSWYDYPGEAGPGVRRSRQLLFELLDAQRVAGFPTEQTFLFGFSQGCLMTLDVGFRYPVRLAGLVGVSGYVHDLPLLLAELSPVAKVQRMLFTHGTMDPLIPCAAAKAQVEALQRGGLHITWADFPKEHTIAREEIPLFQQFIGPGN